MSFQTDNVIEDIDKAMLALRRAMSGLQIRRAGFKRDHDDLARAVGAFTVDLADVVPLDER